MLTLLDILRAQQQMRSIIHASPLVYCDALSEKNEANVWLKMECAQPTGSFKIRGAMYKLMSLSYDELAKGVITASAGNHGLGVAHAAKALGITGVKIYVPVTAPAAKITKLKRFPIELHLVGQSYEEAHHAAEQAALQTGAPYISAYDDLKIIAGAGTCGLEIISQLPEVDTVIVPVGGGGLIAGTAVAVKGINKGCRIIGVQPAASPAAKISIEKNLPIDPYDAAPTIADGLAGGFGAYPFYVARTLIDDVLLFSEVELRRAVFTLVEQQQLIAEASGAIAINPLLAGGNAFSKQNVVCIITGSNIETALLAEILSENIT